MKKRKRYTNTRKVTEIFGEQVYGPSTFKVHNFKVDVNKMLFTYVISFSKLEFVGKYSINARLLLIHLQGAGNMTGYFSKSYYIVI